MKRLDFILVPEDPLGARGAELRATWSRLTIRLDERVVTHHESSRNTLRGDLYLPLYPVAEWIVFNWWALLHEPKVEGRSADIDWRRRHDLSLAGEGFVLPRMEFRPLGSFVKVSLAPSERETPHIRFFESYEVVLEHHEVVQAFEDFISDVVKRLEDEGIADTPLQLEWNALRDLSEDEVAFSKAAARLGLDPFDCTDVTAGKIIGLANVLSSPLFEEISSILEPDELDAPPRWIDAVNEAVVREGGSALPDLKRQFERGINLSELPWMQGYRAAEAIRRKIDFTADGPTSIERFEIAPIRVPIPSAARRIPAFVGGSESRGGVAIFQDRLPVLTNPRDRFLICRSLGEYLFTSPGNFGIVTLADTEAQRRNRAFAAELLAPAEKLRSMIGSREVENETIESIADELRVSELVVRHQIVNHSLADIV